MGELFLEGLQNVLGIQTFILMLLGTTVGIIFGAVPGLSVVMGLVLFLPFTYTMAPAVGISFLVSIYIGATSGGLISAILLNIPGTPNSVATCFDGVPMRKNGQAKKALGLGIVFSFLGTILSSLVLIFVAPQVAKIAIKFGPHEYFAVALFSMVLVASMASKNMIKSFFALALGIGFATVGLSPIDAVQRFTFGNPQLLGGFATLTVLIGLFAIKELLQWAETVKFETEEIEVHAAEQHVKGFGFNLKEFLEQKWNFLISGIIGIIIGIIPGIGGASSNLIAYDFVKNTSKYPEKFGTGIPDGVVASETSNNASIGGALVPLLTLGIPGDGATAVLLGAFMIHGIVPGPLLFQNQAPLVYTIFAAVIIGSLMMLVIEFLGLDLFTKILKVPKHILLPIVLMFTVIGSYALSNRIFDVVAILVFGIIGYFFAKFKISTPPFIIGFILGGMTEENLRRGLIFSDNNFLDFFNKPITAFLLIATVLFIILMVIRYQREKNKNKKGGKSIDE